MKKLLLVFNLVFFSTCIPAPAETVKNCEVKSRDEWFVSIGVSQDNKRIKVKYKTDMMGNIYSGVYVWNGYTWQYCIAGSDEDGTYVMYLGVAYYF